MSRINIYFILCIAVVNSFAQEFSDYQQQWATYYGANQTEFYRGILDLEGNIVALGSFNNSNISEDENYFNQFVTINEPFFQYQSELGVSQSFVAKFSQEGERLSAFFLPFNIDNIRLTETGGFYVIGHTLLNDLSTTTDWFPPVVSDRLKYFIAKLSPEFQIDWFRYIPGDDAGTIEVDELGNVYGSSLTLIDQGITTSGTFQTNFIESYDASGELQRNALLFKLNAEGELLWCTYYGLLDIIEIEYQNNELILGCIGLANLEEIPNYYSTPNAYQTTQSQNAVSRFNSINGQRTFSSYFGENYTHITGVVSDGVNIYISGTAQFGSFTDNNFISLEAYQPEFAGYFDAFLIKTDLNMNPIWGTYIGESGFDAVLLNNIKFFENAIYLSGITDSNDLFDEVPNTFQSSNNGGNDAFMMKFNPNGELVWGTYFGGNNNEALSEIIPLSDSEIYWIGETASQTNIATQGAWQENLLGITSHLIGNGYITYFAEDLDIIYPEITLEDNYQICSNEPLQLLVDAGFQTYLWQGLYGQDVAQNDITSNQVMITQPGAYAVTVTNAQGNSTTHNFMVELIQNLQITSVNITDNQINIQVNYPVDTTYSLDGVNWQESNVFYNLPDGTYTVYAKSTNYCGIAIYELEIFRINIYNIITPNGDGLNDTWELKNVDEYSGAEISIYNRFGKRLIHSIINQNNHFIWNGKYLGATVPTGDYWYQIKLTNGQIVSGSITVKNK